MHIRRLTSGTEQIFIDDYSLGCPYIPVNKDYCSASVMSVPITDRTRNNYCSSEDFDRCPLFLAKILRRCS